MITLAICSQKGGCGKTSTALALSEILTLKGFRALLVDFDPQGDSSTARGAASMYTAADVIRGAVEPSAAIERTEKGDILAADSELSTLEALLLSETGKEYRLTEQLKKIAGDYDFCIIDCPPSLNILSINALTAADFVVTPATTDIFSNTSIAKLSGTIQTVKKYCNPGLLWLGILITRFKARSVLSREMSGDLEQTAEAVGTSLFNTRIRENQAIREAQVYQLGIIEYDTKSNGAADYQAFTDELLERIGQ